MQTPDAEARSRAGTFAVRTTRPPACRVVVTPRPPAVTAGFRPPSRPGDARWIPPGALATVKGFDIVGGMVYIGGFLTAAPGGGWSADFPAPCLINPSLEIASGSARPSSQMVYWPSYTDIAPEHRLTYLTWLSTGKRDPSFSPGFAFLYFYGLERRLLIDNPPAREEALLVAEVERLRTLYGENGSFNEYSTALLDIVALRRLSSGPSGLDAWRPELDGLGEGMSLPLKLKLALHAAAGAPLNFEHAVAGMLSLLPYQGGLRSTASMSQTRQEFLELVRRRFAKRFREGFRLRDRKDSRLAIGYRAAARHLEVDIRFEGPQRLPDPTTLTWTKMAELCSKAAEDLRPYARIIGKERARARCVEAALILPADLADIGAGAPFRLWLGALPSPVAEVPLSALGRWCFGEGQAASGLNPARRMSAILARFGFGMEPDPTHGGEKPGATVLVFFAAGASGAVAAPGAAFHLAALAATVLAAEPGPEGEAMVSRLAARLRLGAAETVRLAARHRLMRGRSLPAARLKMIGAKLTGEERGTVVSIATAAAACGEVSHAALAALERLHDAFGVGRRGLYAALHKGAAAAALRPTEPVAVEQRAAKSNTFRIPPSPAPATHGGGPGIDMARVATILRETREVAGILAPIYQEEVAVPPPVNDGRREGGKGIFSGLNPDHARLLASLCRQETWRRADFEAQARAFGLMPDGAVETINEWAFEALDGELIENGDPLSINVALVPGAPEEAA